MMNNEKNSYDPETSKPESKPDSGFESRNQNFRFRVSGFGWGSPAAAPCLGGFRFPVFPHFSTFFPNFLHFSLLFPSFPHFSTFFLIFSHFWGAPGGLLGALGVACCAGSHPVVLALALSFHPLSGPPCSRSCVGTFAHGQHQMTAERSHLGTAQQW